MTFGMTRRRFLGALAATAIAPHVHSAVTRIIVVGGGFGGATAARTLRTLLPRAAIILVESNRRYLACPFSNLVIAGRRTLEQQAFGYGALRRENIEVIHDAVVDVDGNARTLILQGGQTLDYDRLVLSPGIDFRWDALPGYTPTAVDAMPHAWKAGPQTRQLASQLRAMPDGGLVALAVTAAPFRCPPGPYERASLIASYLKQNKPRSKLLILDSNDKFSKQGLFTESWQRLYGNMIEWRGASLDGRVRRVDPAAMQLETDFDTITADVANVVPPQHAGEIAHRSGVADATGWCPIDAVTFESRLVSNIHVIGDASIAAPMPKSAFSANAQAKVCAIQVARLVNGRAPVATTLANTCYSYVSGDEAISVSGVYHNQGGQFANVTGAGGISPANAPIELRSQEAAQARDWFTAITGEAFGG